MSQSLQVAPFDDFYQFDNSSAYVTIYDQDVTLLNSYLGGIYQQAVSALSYVPNGVYQGTSGQFNIYGTGFYASRTLTLQVSKSSLIPTIDRTDTSRGLPTAPRPGP